MKSEFLCQMVDYDAPDEWTPMQAFDSEIAALDYADVCDGRSAGELFDRNSERQVVLVKLRPENEPLRYMITYEYKKRFHAEQISG